MLVEHMLSANVVALSNPCRIYNGMYFNLIKYKK